MPKFAAAMRGAQTFRADHDTTVTRAKKRRAACAARLAEAKPGISAKN
jgi:hypothetical protein